MMPSVGFIGTGSMGGPMAERIAGAGFPLTVHDASVDRSGELAARIGAQHASTAADLARTADLVITMLPTSSIVASVLDGPEGVLAGLRPGAVIVEMSSGVPAVTKSLAEQVAARGGSLVDAPVSGGVSRARTGELAIMVGGDDAAIEQAEPVLRAMGDRLLRTGPVGSAHAMKALNNLVSAGGFLIGIEALLIGQAFGLDPGVMVDVLNASTGVNNSTQKKFKQYVLSRQFDSGFGLALMAKDLSIALDVARETGVPAPYAALCRELWTAALVSLESGEDHTGMAKLSERLAGMVLASGADPAKPPPN